MAKLHFEIKSCDSTYFCLSFENALVRRQPFDEKLRLIRSISSLLCTCQKIHKRWPFVEKIRLIRTISSLQGYTFWPFPPPLGGIFFLSKLKNREDIEGGLEKRKGKGGGKKKIRKSDKTHVKIPFWSLYDRQKSSKTGKDFRGVGGRIIPLSLLWMI